MFDPGRNPFGDPGAGELTGARHIFERGRGMQGPQARPGAGLAARAGGAMAAGARSMAARFGGFVGLGPVGATVAGAGVAAMALSHPGRERDVAQQAMASPLMGGGTNQLVQGQQRASMGNIPANLLGTVGRGAGVTMGSGMQAEEELHAAMARGQAQQMTDMLQFGGGAVRMGGQGQPRRISTGLFEAEMSKIDALKAEASTRDSRAARWL